MSDPDSTRPERASTASEAEAYCPQCARSFDATVERCPQDGTRLVILAAERDEFLGRVLDGRYEIRSPLGRGGMGTVYLGVQLSVDREVAIKVIHPKLASDRNAVKRFLREARLASRLNQPSIVNVYDFGQSDGVLFLVTELLRGHTLASELGQGRRLNVRRSAVIGIQLCDALEAAHAQDIVHRDLKPGNIVILDDPPGRDLVKVLDFGLAKSLAGDADRAADGSHLTTNLGAVVGTPTYMAPEQIEGLPSDQRADLYALGCILYEMVSGAPPFVDPSVSTVLARHIGDTPAPLPGHVPMRYRNLVERLLAKSPADRVQAAGDVRRVLQSTVEATPASGIPIVSMTADGPDTMPDLRVALADTAAHTALLDAPDSARMSKRIGTEPTVAAMAMPAAIAASVAPTEAQPVHPAPVRSRRPMLVIAGVFAAAVAAAVFVLWAAPGPSDARAPSATTHATHDAAVTPPPAVDAAAAAAPAVDAAPPPAIVLPPVTPPPHTVPHVTPKPQPKPQPKPKPLPHAGSGDLDFYPTQ